MKSISAALLTLLVLPFVAPDVALAQYPDRPIRVIFPYAGGSTGDAQARLYAAGAQKYLGQNVIVENRPGAAGNIGYAQSAQATPDGYTLLSVSPAFTLNPSLYSKPGYDPLKDFVPLASLNITPNVLYVQTSSPYKNLKDLIDDAKARPGKLNFASSGNGTSIHLAAELLKLQAGINLVHVPYSGAGPAATSVISGETQLMFASGLGLLQGGQLKALVVAHTARFPTAPDVPTAPEAGFPGLINGSWTGVVAPVQTPKPIVDKLAQAFAQAAKDPEVVETLAAKFGGLPFIGTPDQFGAFLKKELETNAVLVQQLNLKIE